MSGNHRKPNGRRRTFRPPWANWEDEELLELRMCDLGIHIPGTPVEPCVLRLYEELAARSIRFRPHCWFSEEWFSPDGVPGIAIPFYLAHPRLMRLERKMMLEVEGGTKESCMKILRHEAGHALDTSYRLKRRKGYREVFGRSSIPYPEFYKPKPLSKRYVLHLDLWYAQAHPTEDFAETFAVWLKPLSRWRSQYHDWPALKKLEYVDALMDEIKDTTAVVRSREQVEPVRDNRTTLREHYRKKREYYGVDEPHVYDMDLRQLFSDAPADAHRMPATVFLRRLRSDLRQVVSKWTGEYQYTIDQVLAEMIARCRELKLRVARPQKEVERELLVLLTVNTMNYLHAGFHRLAL